MGIVYLLGKSLFHERSIELYLDASDLQARQKQDVKVVFMHDGVLVASRGNSFERNLLALQRSGVQIYFRKEDLLARGLVNEMVSPAGTIIDTKQLIEVLAGATTVVSAL